MSDQSGAAAHDDPRDLPDRLSLRHSKLEAKRRLAAGEFTTLHDAQLAVAREHGMSSWAALKEHIAAEAERSHALAQVRWLFGRYGEAGAPGWTAPSRDELSEHFTGHLLTLVPPETAAAILGGVAAKLREDLIIIDADSSHLRAKVADLLVEADVEPEAPHRLTVLALFPGGAPATDPRVRQPPAASFGTVPEQVTDIVEDSCAELGLVGLTAAGDWGSGPASDVWACSRGWADLERNAPWSTGPDLVRFGSGWRTLLPAELAEQALRPHAQQYDSAAEIGLGWLLRRPLDVVGHAGGGPGSSASLITRPGGGRTSVVLTNRMVQVEPTNARLIRAAG